MPAAVFLALFLLLLPLPRIYGQSPGSLLEAIPEPGFTPAQIDAMSRPLFEGFEQPASRLPVSVYRLIFSSRDFDGSSAEIHARLFVPVYAVRTESPVLVFGSGTTGVADACAPSREQPELHRWGYYRANMLAYASQGFITIFPDYLGFNDPGRPQRYFSLKAEGQVLLDAARAVYRFFERHDLPARPAAAVFTAGYSQGGHAAFAAADLQRDYAPEVPLLGAIGFAPTTDVAVLFREGPYYAPYILYNYSDIYGRETIDPSRYILDRWARTLEEDAERMCVDQFQAYYPFDGRRLYRPEMYDALHGGQLERRFPALARALQENNSGLSGHGLPALVVQGGEDIIVTTKTQDRFVTELRTAGSEVRYLVFPGVRHRYTRPAGFLPSLSWMKARLRSLPALQNLPAVKEIGP
ncbi:MAG: alpha/beta hydrolase [Spirochaetales bacterium]|nr:alpha/beta hydrolase [Spirochaetales bacterium]